MKVFLPFILALSFFLPQQLKSQASIANYSTAWTTGNTYNSIVSSGTAFDSWRNTATYSQDDNRSDLTDIGFDFWYDGTRYTQFSVSTNGFIDFSSSTADGTGLGAYGYDNTNFTGNGSGTWLSIAPFYDDLTAQGGAAALGNSIKYQLSGTAPSRTLTIEWINMAVYGNTAPSLNFQVKLYETTGVIELNYGTMNNGGVTFSYSLGINGPTLNNTATAAQLKCQQTANSNTFNNTETNNLSALPAAGTRYRFTPPVPGTPTGSLTFSGVTQTGMTLNWTNWASNEVGYVIYNSTDNITFRFVAQTTVNATNYAVTGLSPSTTYYWKLYGVTEGCLSSNLSGTQATLTAGNKVSNASGSWNTPGIWTPTGVPSATDNVTISSTHTVTINTNALCNNLIIGGASGSTLAIGNNNTARTLTISGSLTINTGSTLNVPTTSNTTHTITISDNIINNGTLNLATDGNSLCNAVIQKNGNLTVSGTGATTTFNSIAMTMGTSINNILEFTTPSFAAASNFLTLNTGTFKLSTTGASSITPFTGTITVPQKGGMWLNSAGSAMNFGGSVTMYGNITNSNGTMNIGNAADEDLVSNGGVLTASNGTINIAGKYYATGINNLSKFNINGGTVILPTSGSTSTTIAPFQIAGAGSQFSMTGGSLIIRREGGTGAQNLGFINTGATGGSVTGGTLQIGDASTPATQTMQINSSYPIPNLLVNSANATASVQTNALTVISDVTLTAGTLLANSIDINVGGNWTNNGGTFTGGTGTVIFDGSGAQAINGTAASQTFNNINVSKTSGTTLAAGGSTTAITTNNLTMTSGNFTGPATLNVAAAATSSVILNGGTFTAGPATFVKGDWTNNGGTFTPGSNTVTFSGTTAQAINGTAASQTFNDVVIAKTAGTTLSAGGSTTSITTNNLTQTTGNFTAPATLNVTAGSSSSILLTAGTFTSGSAINLNGNWTNNGATFTPGTGTVTLTGTSAQTIFKSGGETFYNLVSANSGTKTLGSAITTNAGFTINSGSTFDVSTSNYQVTVKGNFSNSGSMLTRSGNVFMNGTTSQSIGGSTITDFYDLTLNNSAGALITNDENIIDALVLNNGTFNTNSKNFTLISTATGSGRIATITGTGDITGNVIVQRYAPGGYTGWAFLGAPITSALTYADWDDNIPISCNSCPDGSANGFESIYTYDETVGGAFDNASAYIPIVTINDAITNGKGYWVYFGDGYTTTNNIMFDVKGTVRKGNYSIPITRTNTGSAADDGWNLISNPYPSPIRWSLLKGATTGIDNSVYVYNADLNGGTGAYATYINGISSPKVGLGGVGDTIPIAQGFYVHSTGATSLSGTENIKVGGNPTFLRQINPYQVATSVSNPLIRLYLDESTGTFHDETVLYTQSGATHDFDEDYDSYKLAGGDIYAPTIALENNGRTFQVNGVEPITSSFTMPLKTVTGYAGNYTITTEGVSTFPQGVCILLYDTYTGTSTDLTTGGYTFALSDTTVQSRFLITITINPLQINSATNEPTCQAPNSGEIIAAGANSGPWNYYWMDGNGNPVQTSLNKPTADTLSGLVSGNYTLIVNTVGMCDNSTTQYTINAITIDPLQVNSTTNDPTCQAPTGGNIIAIGASSGPWNYYWTDGSGNPVQTSLNKPTADTLSGLVSGGYILTVKTAGMCDSGSVQYTINAVDVPDAQFSSSTDTVYLSSGGIIDFTNASIDATSSTWNFGDNNGASSLTSPSYTYNAAGIYTIALIVQSATGCEDSISHQVLVIDDITGIKNNTQVNGLVIKTVAESQYQVQQRLDRVQRVSFRLMDTNGKMIRDYGQQITDSVMQQVDLRDYQGGIYYLRITTETGSIVIKLLKS